MESPQNIILNGQHSFSDKNADLNEGFKLTFLVKLVFVFGVYEIHDYLHYLHPILLILLISAVHVLASLAIQRPKYADLFKNRKVFLSIAALNSCQSLCWIYALRYSGSLRSIVLFGFNDGIRILASFCKNPSLRCSGIFYILGLISCVGSVNAMTGCFLSIVDNLLDLLSKKAHLKIDKTVQRADSEVLVETLSFAMILVLYAFLRLFGYGVHTHHVLDEPISMISIIFPMITFGIFTKTLPWLAEFRKLKLYCHPKTSVLWYRYELFAAFLFGYLWDHPVTSKVSGLMREEIIGRKSHELEGNIIVLSLFFLMADWYWRGRSSSPPLTTSTSGFSISKCILDLAAKSSADPVLRTKTFFTFLSISISALTCAVAGYNNSLALFGAALLTIFNSNKIILSLVKGLVSNSKPSKMFNFGLASVESLVDYLLSVLIVMSCFLIAKESIVRMTFSTDVSTEFALLITTISICVNLGGYGLFGEEFLRKMDEFENPSLWKEMLRANIGFIAIVISVFLNSWTIFDSLVALAIASFVGYKSLPILKNSSEILLLRCPSSIERAFKEALHKIMQMKEVESYRDHRCWTLSPNVFCCSIVLHISEAAVENTVICVAGQYFKEAGITEITIQCEKDICHAYLAGSQAQSAKSKFEWLQPKNQDSDIYI